MKLKQTHVDAMGIFLSTVLWMCLRENRDGLEGYFLFSPMKIWIWEVDKNSEVLIKGSEFVVQSLAK